MKRRVWLTIYGLLVGIAYAAILQCAVPGQSDWLPVRGLNLVVLSALYGWCCGKDTLLPDRRLLLEIPLIPFVLLGALLAGCVCLMSLVFTRSLCALRKPFVD